MPTEEEVKCVPSEQLHYSSQYMRATEIPHESEVMLALVPWEAKKCILVKTLVQCVWEHYHLEKALTNALLVTQLYILII